jgi:hypothetical protein
MHFVCVDQIQLLYNYQADPVRTEMCDTYVDEQAGRFYILKNFEKSEIRYIETMAKYLVQDRVALAELITFMMGLSQIYQNEDIQGLIKQRDRIIIQEHDYRWTFPNVYVIPSSPPPPPPSSEENSLNDEPIHISIEKTEQLMNEPMPERKHRSQITTEKDEEKNPICFPAKANTNESTEFSNTKPHPIEQRQSTDSSNVSNSNHSSSSDSISQVSSQSDRSHKIKSKPIIERRLLLFILSFFPNRLRKRRVDPYRPTSCCYY